jgi:hypothetical protein
LPVGETLRLLLHILDIPRLRFITKKSKVPILTVPMTRNDRRVDVARWIGSDTQIGESPVARTGLEVATTGPQSAMARERA